MKTDLKTILALGEKRGCAIPAFNVYNLETLMGVMQAAQQTGAPVIFQMYSRLFDGPSASLLAPSILKAIDELSTPAAFHLDHGAGIPQVLRALRHGATGIMLDASSMPFEENIQKTKQAVDYCAQCGVFVEGELGHVGTTIDATMGEFTNPDEAAVFAQKTGVSALAILVGTAHGRYQKAPRLDIDRIKQIKKATGLPLVLHGGSGVPDDQIRAAIKAGVRKVNFGTDLCYAFLDGVFNVSRDIFAIDLFMQQPIEAAKRFAIEKIKLLGADTHG